MPPEPNHQQKEVTKFKQVLQRMGFVQVGDREGSVHLASPSRQSVLLQIFHIFVQRK
jgi:hypothetical protein